MPNSSARHLRRNATESERRVWELLRGRRLEGFKFRRQHPIGPYIADFVCVAAKLVIELDGGQHCNAPNDARRTAWMQACGWRVVRFWNNEIFETPDLVIEAILAELNKP